MTNTDPGARAHGDQQPVGSGRACVGRASGEVGHPASRTGVCSGPGPQYALGRTPLDALRPLRFPDRYPSAADHQFHPVG